MNRPEDFPNGSEVWSEPLQWLGDSRLIQDHKPIPLVLSPQPCVYRTSAIKTLEKSGRSWRLVFSSTSYTSAVAAVKAGMGITVMPHTMIPHELQPIESTMLPNLPETHVCLLKHKADNAAINTLEEFVLKKTETLNNQTIKSKMLFVFPSNNKPFTSIAKSCIQRPV